MIHVENLRFRYPHSDFLLAVPHLHVPPETTTALVGPSGCGKTTLLNLIAGIATAEEGRVTVDGVEISALGEDARRGFRASRVGLVFQEFELLDYLTVLDNMLLPYQIGAGLHLDDEVRDRARALADEVGLGDKLKRRPEPATGPEVRLAADLPRTAGISTTSRRIWLATRPRRGRRTAGSRRRRTHAQTTSTPIATATCTAAPRTGAGRLARRVAGRKAAVPARETASLPSDLRRPTDLRRPRVRRRAVRRALRRPADPARLRHPREAPTVAAARSVVTTVPASADRHARTPIAARPHARDRPAGDGAECLASRGEERMYPYLNRSAVWLEAKPRRRKP